MKRPLYVAVEGPIGVGKTTLVRGLSARLQARLVLEVVEENPFLSRFYEDRDRYAFQTQLFFLMSRFKQQQELNQGDLFTPSVLADYHLLKDRIFARLTLKDDELALYERVYQSLELHILQPDVLVYLHAPLEVLQERIRWRGRPFEANFDPSYLSRLSAHYQHYFAHYTRTPLLDVDTSDIDYASDAAMLARLEAEIVRLARAEEGTPRVVRIERADQLPMSF
ncbi:MAG: deoxynucleoside kinase [Myxococcales bacterium]|nr:deoxynucleoside kinase [Myxococcales bacterium]MCB9548188.1 deoxynucleoside kinase [Myxococcales bacterium]